MASYYFAFDGTVGGGQPIGEGYGHSLGGELERAKGRVQTRVEDKEDELGGYTFTARIKSGDDDSMMMGVTADVDPVAPYRGTLVTFPRGGLDFGEEGEYEMAVLSVRATYNYPKRRFYLSVIGFSASQADPVLTMRVVLSDMSLVSDAYELAEMMSRDAIAVPITGASTITHRLSDIMDVWALDEETIRISKKLETESGIHQIDMSMWSKATSSACEFWRDGKPLEPRTTWAALKDLANDNPQPYVPGKYGGFVDIWSDEPDGLAIFEVPGPNEASVDMKMTGMVVKPTMVEVHSPDLVSSSVELTELSPSQRPGRVFSAPLGKDVNKGHTLALEPKVVVYHAMKGGMQYSSLVDITMHCPPGSKEFAPTVDEATVVCHVRRRAARHRGK